MQLCIQFYSNNNSDKINGRRKKTNEYSLWVLHFFFSLSFSPSPHSECAWEWARICGMNVGRGWRAEVSHVLIHVNSTRERERQNENEIRYSYSRPCRYEVSRYFYAVSSSSSKQARTHIYLRCRCERICYVAARLDLPEVARREGNRSIFSFLTAKLIRQAVYMRYWPSVD